MRYKVEYEIGEGDEISTPSEVFLVSNVNFDSNLIEVIPSKTKKKEIWSFDNFIGNFIVIKGNKNTFRRR